MTFWKKESIIPSETFNSKNHLIFVPDRDALEVDWDGDQRSYAIYVGNTLSSAYGLSGAARGTLCGTTASVLQPKSQIVNCNAPTTGSYVYITTTQATRLILNRFKVHISDWYGYSA